MNELKSNNTEDFTPLFPSLPLVKAPGLQCLCAYHIRLPQKLITGEEGKAGKP